ncbi:MAG: phosphoribosylformylglycinamidine synthase subunit PurQ [Saprospiraceae bacterium]
MKELNVGIVVFPGSNCDDDLVHILGTVCKIQVQKIWHKEHQLPDLDAVFLPGGFSYGDYLRSGAIARYANIMPAIQSFAEQGGLVWGICNGFQILCEAGLLPGALASNKNQKYICENIFLKVMTDQSAISNTMNPGSILKIPIAHGDGRYYADDATLQQLIEGDQIIFKYCDPHGNINDEANVNGSLMNIAGICNAGRNVFGMMPHPERASEDILGNKDGLSMFQSMVHYLKEVTVTS